MHNTRLAWQCSNCRAEGKFRATKCSQGCRNQRSFVPLRSSKSTICMGRQMLRIQEADSEDGVRVPRTVDCELLADLCDSCMLGDVVKVTGVVKVTTEEEAGHGSKKHSQYLLYISGLQQSE